MFEEISDALCHGQVPVVVSLCRDALSQGITAASILNDGLLPGMNTVGKRFAAGDVFIPEVMLSARAMQAGVDVIREALGENGAASCGTVVLGTVLGDQHDIGKNLVRIMLEGAGFSVVDLGVNVAPARFVDVAREKGAKLIALSALLTTTMPQMEVTVKLAHAAGMLVMIGGAPVTEAYAEKIGADGYAADAASAAELAKRLLS